MDWEAPVDGWYTYLAVSLVTVGFLGIVLSLPTGPPPDANRAANTIDEVAGASYEAHDSESLDAEWVRVRSRSVSLRNEHGTTHAELAFGGVVLVNGNDRLEALAGGEEVESVFDPEVRDDGVVATQAIVEELEGAVDRNHGNWNVSNGELVVRTVSWDITDVGWSGNLTVWVQWLRDRNVGIGSIVATGDARDAIANEYPWLEHHQGRFYATVLIA